METKTEKLSRAFSELGTEIGYKQFAKYCEDNFGIRNIPQSTFYSMRRGMTKQTKPVVEVLPSADPENMVAMSELPAILANARSLLDRFGNDKDALIAFIRAI
jgi:hypothetical protein